jgi:hypothetical protein
MISRDLDILEENGCIEGKKVKSERGRKKSTSYSIVLRILNLRHILKKYPDLIPKMQKNDSILECIFRENLDLICGLNNLEFLNNRFAGPLNKKWSCESPRTPVSRSYPLFDSNKNYRAKHKEVFFKKRERSFKKKLQSSPEFFRLFLITDKNKLIVYIKKPFMVFLGKGCITDQKYNQDPDNSMTIYILTFYITRTFQACVFMDEFKKDIISDEQIYQLKRQMIQNLKLTLKAVSNASNLQFRESIFEIRELRKAMIEYLIITSDKKLNAKIQEFEKYLIGLI